MNRFLIVISIVPTTYYRTNTRIHLKPAVERGIREQKRCPKPQGGGETAKDTTRVHEGDTIMITAITTNMSFGYTLLDESQARQVWYGAWPKFQ